MVAWIFFLALVVIIGFIMSYSPGKNRPYGRPGAGSEWNRMKIAKGCHPNYDRHGNPR